MSALYLALGVLIHLAAPRRPRLRLVHPGNLTVH
jgi:hypothetical protein